MGREGVSEEHAFKFQIHHLYLCAKGKSPTLSPSLFSVTMKVPIMTTFKAFFIVIGEIDYICVFMHGHLQI